MTELIFRNVDVSPDEPVEAWPLEAIQTALERGSLSHWRRLGAAIQAQPWGRVARDVEEVLTYSRPYGVAKMMERVIEQARRDIEATERMEVAAEVRRLIKESGLTRRAFASRIGTSTSRLSTYATGKVTPSAALILRMRKVNDGGARLVPERRGQGFASLVGASRGRVRIADHFDELPDGLADPSAWTPDPPARHPRRSLVDGRRTGSGWRRGQGRDRPGPGLVSAVVLWEVAIKRRLGKLDAPADLLDQLDRAAVDLLPITPRHADRVGTLPPTTATPSTACSLPRLTATASRLSLSTR